MKTITFNDGSTMDMLPCPFCGKEADYTDNYQWFYVGCFDVDCPGGTADSDVGFQQANKKWNTRADIPTGSKITKKMLADMDKEVDAILERDKPNWLRKKNQSNQPDTDINTAFTAC